MLQARRGASLGQWWCRQQCVGNTEKTQPRRLQTANGNWNKRPCGRFPSQSKHAVLIISPLFPLSLRVETPEKNAAINVLLLCDAVYHPFRGQYYCRAAHYLCQRLDLSPALSPSWRNRYDCSWPANPYKLPRILVQRSNFALRTRLSA